MKLDILNYRELLVSMVKRSLKVKYKGSLLGFIWSLLHPLLLMLVYTLVFGVVFKGLRDVQNYPVFLLGGLLPWIAFESSINTAGASINASFHLINQVRFPNELLPSSVVIANFINFVVSLSIMLLFMVIYKIPFSVYMLWFPIILLIHIFLAIGISFIVATLNVFFKDTGMIISVLFRAWFFLSPIVYPLDRIPEHVLFLYKLNPTVSFIMGYKSIFVNSCNIDIKLTLYGLVVSVVVLIIGFLYFKTQEHKFIKVI